MIDDKDKIDDLYKNRFDDFELPVSDELMLNIKKELNVTSSKKGFNYRRLIMFFSIAIIGAVGAGIIYFSISNGDTQMAQNRIQQIEPFKSNEASDDLSNSSSENGKEINVENPAQLSNNSSTSVSDNNSSSNNETESEITASENDNKNVSDNVSASDNKNFANTSTDINKKLDNKVNQKEQKNKSDKSIYTDLKKANTSTNNNTNVDKKASKYLDKNAPAEKKESKRLDKNAPAEKKESKYLDKNAPAEKKESKHLDKNAPAEKKESKHLDKNAPAEKKESKHLDKNAPAEKKESKHLDKNAPAEKKENKSDENKTVTTDSKNLMVSDSNQNISNAVGADNKQDSLKNKDENKKLENTVVSSVPKQEEIKNKPDEKAKTPTATKFFVDVNGGTSFAYRALSGSNTALQNRNDNEEKITTYNAGVDFGISMKDKFIVNIGVGVDNKGEKYSFQYQALILKTNTTMVIDTTNGQNDTIYVVDTLQYQPAIDEKTVVNKYQYLKIPIMIGYQFTIKEKFFIRPSVGVTLNYLLNASSTWYDPNVKRVIEYTKADKQYNTLVFAGRVRLDLGMNINDKLSFSIQPGYTRYLQSIYKKETNFKHIPYSYDINIGVRYKF